VKVKYGDRVNSIEDLRNDKINMRIKVPNGMSNSSANRLLSS
jgi:hypothetical protein